MIMAPDTIVAVAPGVYADKAHKVDAAPEKRLLLLDDAGWALLGLSRSQEVTLRRLHEAGFINIIQIAPRVWFLDVDSWEEHLDRVSDDPWFWERQGKNLEKYRGTYS